MQIVKTQIELGVEKPFTFLQTTDTHLVFTDENDTEARREFARARGRDFSHAEETPLLSGSMWQRPVIPSSIPAI